MEQDKLKSPFYALITDARREGIVNLGFPNPVKKEQYCLHVGELALFHPDVLRFYEAPKNPILPEVASAGLKVMTFISHIDLSGKSNNLFAHYRYQEGDIPLVLHSMFERQARLKGNGYLISILREGEFMPLYSQALDNLLTDDLEIIRTSHGIPDRYPEEGSLEDTFRHLAAFPILMKGKIENIRVECAPRTISPEEIRQEQEHADRMQAVEEDEAEQARVRSKIMHQVVGAEEY